MESTLGRYFDGFRFETQTLLKRVIDLVLGQGSSIALMVEGRELVFRASPGGRGFLRLLPQNGGIVFAFPRGPELFDPQAKLAGPVGLQKSMRIFDANDIDPYLRRIVREAYLLDAHS